MPLVVCATPIGNLEDVTLRVLRALAEADVVLCEDTRHTRILLDRHGIAVRRLVSLHEHNESARIRELVPRLAAGDTLALVSDAGLPGVSDPGTALVTAALAAGAPVTVLPGASAVETALVASGLAWGEYRFLGFLPRQEAALRRLWEESRAWPYALVAFESPRRLSRALATLAGVSPTREVAVCRELTKRFEEVARGAASDLATRFAEPVKGEVTIVVAPPADEADEAEDDDGAVEAVAELVAAGASRKTAVEVVARLVGTSRNRLYEESLDSRV